MLNNWIKGNPPTLNLKNSSIKIATHLEGESLGDLNPFSVALISSDNEIAVGIKEALSNFQNHFNQINIIDLGTFRKEDPAFNIQLINEMINSNIIPIIINKDFRWFSAVTSGITKKDNFLNLCISNKIQFSEYGLPTDYIGFQRHLIDKDHLIRIMDHSINSMSLGKTRAELNELEPILRDVHHAYIDLSSIRKADVPGSHNSISTGFTAEELCQIAKYLGRSNNLKMLTIGGDLFVNEITHTTIAEMIWYCLEGMNTKIMDHPSVNKNFKEFVVDQGEIDESLIFIKNNETGRWWFKASMNEGSDTLVSCSYGEYEKTISNELPVRLLKHLTKI